MIKDAYHSVPRAALGLSDHCLGHLIPTYRQKLKSAKPVLRTVNRWTNQTERVLQACFDLTDWTVFEAAANDLDELTETVDNEEVSYRSQVQYGVPQGLSTRAVTFHALYVTLGKYH